MKTYTISIDQQQLEVISQALGQQPYVQVVSLITELNRQLQLQMPTTEELNSGK